MVVATAPLVPDIQATFESLLRSDPACLDRDELAAVVGDLRLLRCWCDALEVKVTRRSRQLAQAGRCEPPRSLLGERGTRSANGTRAAEDRSEVCDQLGGFETALEVGEITAEYLDAIAQAQRGLDETGRAEFGQHLGALMVAARSERIETFQRRCRQLGRRITAGGQPGEDELTRQRRQSKVTRWADRSTGMHKTLVELDPLRDAKLWSAIDAHLVRLRQQRATGRVPWAQLQVDALVGAFEAGLTGFPNGSRTGSRRSTATEPASATASAIVSAAGVEAGVGGAIHGRVPEICVHVDLDTLQHRLDGLCETRDGTNLSVDTARRLCCDAEVIPILLGTDNVTLDQGRSTRTATREQRRALAAMYSTCAHPDCEMPFTATRAHHVRHWLDHHGPTDLDNLLPLCEQHHHLVHEGGWQLTLRPDRTTTWHRPDGTHWWTGCSINRSGPLAR